MKKKRFPIIIAAVVFGVLVWLSVNMRDDYQVTVAAPLSIQDIPRGWAIKTPIPRTVQLRFRGDGWRLAALLLGPELKIGIPCVVVPPAPQVITFDDINERIPSFAGIQLLDAKPDSLYVGFDRYDEKRVPVVVHPVVSFKDGYGQVGPIGVTPDSVTIGGAATIVQGITSWSTVPGNFEELKAPVETSIPLATAATYPLSLVPSSVHISINVQPFAEKTFSGLPVEVRSVPSTREVILIPPKIEVVARGGIKQLSALSSSDFNVSVDFEAITADTTGSIAAAVKAPSGIQVVGRRPERLQYIVRKRL